jgi:predicted nucleotidyltransferase
VSAETSIQVPHEAIRDFCQRWKITELALFGSAARAELRPESDVDVMVTFAEDAHWSLFDLGAMQQELTSLFGRDTDLVEKGSIRNPFRRRSIARDLMVVYARLTSATSRVSGRCAMRLSA